MRREGSASLDAVESQPLTAGDGPFQSPSPPRPPLLPRQGAAVAAPESPAGRKRGTACKVALFAAAVLLLLWASFPGEGSLFGRSAAAGAAKRLAPAAAPPADECPVYYPPHSLAEVAAGARPYLFGAQPPGCKVCRRGYNESSLRAGEHHYCEFWSQNWAPEPWGTPVCPTWLVNRLQGDWISRGWTAPLTLTPCDLHAFLGPAGGRPGRTLWVVGDSQSASLFEALKCFLHAFLTNAGEKAQPADLPFNSTHGLDADTAALAEQQQQLGAECRTLEAGGTADGGRLCYLRGDIWKNQIQSRVLPLLAAANATRRDIMVVNTGLHFSKTYKEDLGEFLHWYAQHRSTAPFLVWKDTPTQHFDQAAGEWPTGGKPPFTCKPITGGRVNISADHRLFSSYEGGEPMWKGAVAAILQGGWRNEQATAVMAAAKVPVSATYNETAPLWQYHRDNGAGYECTHFCAPSAPQVWVHGLVQTLRAHVLQLNAHFGAAELGGIPPAEWPA